ncbi:MAG: hypothetical protein DGJ47_000428 [Rickettsiaceae bacterium]
MVFYISQLVMNDKEKYYSNKLNKTFARRIGRKLTPIHQKMVDEKLPQYLYSSNKLNGSQYSKKILEIGFGMGEHFVSQSSANPKNLYIGAEVYMNGVANMLKLIESENFMVWPDDVNLILQDMPDHSLDGIYILFPDPWHKRKYLPRRLVNSARLSVFKRVLKSGGFISFASDITDYFDLAKNLLINDSDLKLLHDDYSKPHSGYIQTKYHTKANSEGRDSQFITVIKDARY